VKDITIQKFKQNIYDMGLLSCNKKIAIAVSGGPDSVALLILAKTCFYDSTDIIALTFNHNLRENSSTESSQVHELCRSLDIEHHIFEWQHNNIKNNSIEASAREARYESMTKFCKENDICSLLVGHTLDDKIENFFTSCLENLTRSVLLEIFPYSCGWTFLCSLLFVLHETQSGTVVIIYGQEWYNA